MARDVLTRRLSRQSRGAQQYSGLLVAEGDSWFDYPFSDVLEQLEEDFHYEVESVAHKGDTAEGMAYEPKQLDKVARLLLKLKRDERTPRAILMSGGGNDISEDLALCLNNKSSGLPPLSESVLVGVIDQRLRVIMIQLAAAVTYLCREIFEATIPILMHGYDYPVPDGRGYAGGFWLLPGPWLEPGFRRKGYHELSERANLMVTMVDRFNGVLCDVAGSPGLAHVRHLDLRGTLSNQIQGQDYKKWWRDEMHPTRQGFTAVATRFDEALRSF